MAILHVERVGGLAGFGGSQARIRSRGELDTTELSAVERETVDSLFRSKGAAPKHGIADGFRIQLTRTTPDGTETIEAPESVVPAKVVACVKDEFV